ncbi:MFS transporter [Saccharopolyspora shandongensis]|uniref:MFS transporter n=1 Tax=Saccharopolyspora shandongensis TaxID=418495 RepID=UPI0033E620D8
MSTKQLPGGISPTVGTGSAHRAPLRAWLVVAALVLFMVVNWADRSILGLTAKPIMAELGLTPAQFGFIGSAFFFLFSISGVIVSFLANRVSSRWILLVLVFVWSLCQLPIVVTSSLTVLLISRIVLGAAEGPSNGLATHSAYTWFTSERRGLPSSLITSGSSIAKFVMAPVMTLVIVGFGWRAAFLSLAVLGFAWCVIWLFVGKEGPYSASKQAVDDSEESASETKVPLHRILLCGTFLGAVIGTFPQYGLITVVMTWLPSYFETALGFSPVQAGTFFGLPSFGAMLAMIGGSYVTDRVLARGGSARVARGVVGGAALIIGGGLVVVLTMVRSPYLVLGLFVLGYGISMCCMPLMYAVIGSMAPTRQRAGVLGVFLAVQNSAGIIAPAVAGALISASPDEATGYNNIFLLCGALVVIGGIVMVLLVNPERDARRLGMA